MTNKTNLLIGYCIISAILSIAIIYSVYIFRSSLKSLKIKQNKKQIRISEEEKADKERAEWRDSIRLHHSDESELRAKYLVFGVLNFANDRLGMIPLIASFLDQYQDIDLEAFKEKYDITEVDTKYADEEESDFKDKT